MKLSAEKFDSAPSGAFPIILERDGGTRNAEPAAPQKTVLETILDWSKDRPLWQRDALRHIIANGRLTDADIGELLDLCKQGKVPP